MFRHQQIVICDYKFVSNCDDTYTFLTQKKESQYKHDQKVIIDI